MNECATPILWFPIEDAALCTNCDAVFPLTLHCPACASEQVMSLARWLNRDDPVRAAAQFVVDACESGFQQLGMVGPDRRRMGAIWYEAYGRLSAALKGGMRSASHPTHTDTRSRG